MRIINGLAFNYDEKNVLRQLDDDGGDALSRSSNVAQWMGMSSSDKSAPEFLNERSKFMVALEAMKDPSSPGDYFRDWKPPYNPPSKDFLMSRDNKMQAVMAMGAMGMPGYVAQAFSADLKRFMRTPNGDFLFISEYAIYIRSMWASISDFRCLNKKYKALFIESRIALLYFYLFLVVFDLGSLINVLLIVLLKGREPGPVRRFLADKLGMFFLVQDYPKSVNPNNPDAWSKHGWNNVGDDVLLKRSMSLAKRNLPTPVSWLTRKLYAWLRPSYANIPFNGFDRATNTIYRIRDCENTAAQYSDDVYYMPSSYANPIGDLYREMNKADFS